MPQNAADKKSSSRNEIRYGYSICVCTWSQHITDPFYRLYGDRLDDFNYLRFIHV